VREEVLPTNADHRVALPTGERQYHIGLGPGELAEYILLPGDPDRTARIATRLDSIELERRNREFATVTGSYRGLRISVISTGIGTDNVEIVVAEVLAITERPTFIRVGSCGSLQPEIELGDLVSTTVARAELHARALGVSFDVDVAPSRVRGAPGRLERAVANLLDNAVKWSPPGGTVEVASAAGQVTVRDHGPGIPEADLSKVFDRFYRAPAARSMPGSGLGLAIVREVVEAEGGTVRAGNDPGGGALVEIRLPAIP